MAEEGPTSQGQRGDTNMGNHLGFRGGIKEKIASGIRLSA